MDDGRQGQREAGSKGGRATRDTQGNDHFRRIGARGGETTMRRHADTYDEYRRRGGAATRERYGSEHYRAIGQRSARERQARQYWRNVAIQALIDQGWKIPSIIQLQLDDLPQLSHDTATEALSKYLELERPATPSTALFVSQTGKPLGLANTYDVMRRFQQVHDWETELHPSRDHTPNNTG